MGRRNGDHGIHRSGSGLEMYDEMVYFASGKNTGAETGRPCKLRSRNLAMPFEAPLPLRSDPKPRRSAQESPSFHRLGSFFANRAPGRLPLRPDLKGRLTAREERGTIVLLRPMVP